MLLEKQSHPGLSFSRVHKDDYGDLCADILEVVENFSSYNLEKAGWKSASLITREIQIKTTMSLSPVRMALLQKKISAAKDVEKSEPSGTARGNINWYSHYGEWCGGSSGN